MELAAAPPHTQPHTHRQPPPALQRCTGYRWLEPARLIFKALTKRAAPAKLVITATHCLNCGALAGDSLKGSPLGTCGREGGGGWDVQGKEEAREGGRKEQPDSVVPAPPTPCAVIPEGKASGSNWTSSLPLHALLGPRHQMKGTRKNGVFLSARPTTPTASATAAEAHTLGRGGNMAPPAGGGTGSATHGSWRVAASICCVAASQGEGRGSSALPPAYPSSSFPFLSALLSQTRDCSPWAASRRCCLAAEGREGRPWAAASPLSAGRSCRVAIRCSRGGFGRRGRISYSRGMCGLNTRVRTQCIYRHTLTEPQNSLGWEGPPKLI